MKIKYCLLALVSLLFFSCEDFMDVHKDYIEGGEIIYSTKPDSVSFVAGKERIQFTCWTYNAPNVKTIDVYWNDQLDSLQIPVTMGTGRDSITVILENMEPKAYTFNIRTTDNFGHKSLFVSDFGTSYGDVYYSTLIDRRVRNLDLSDKGGTITWYSKLDGLVRNEVRYTKQDGTQAVVFMPAEDNSVLCPDLKPGTGFEYRSLYIPEEEAIDTFATAWVEYEEVFPMEYKYDRSGWTVLAVSDETASDGGGKDAIIDGDLNTWWHSNYTGENTPLPHWAIIDMESAKEMTKIELHRHADIKTVEIYVNDKPEADDSGWVKIAEGTFDGSSLTIDIPSSVDTTKGRYMKVNITESNRVPFTSLSEIYVYGE